jgi:hypothetical protein
MKKKEPAGKKEEIKVVDKRRIREDSGEEDEVPPEEEGGEEARAAGDPCGQFPERMDFITFILSMSQTAFVSLGCGPYPDMGKCDCDLRSAKMTIDILEVLQEKTKGNLTGEEERILDRILAELRLMWVEKKKQTGTVTQ